MSLQQHRDHRQDGYDCNFSKTVAVTWQNTVKNFSFTTYELSQRAYYVIRTDCGTLFASILYTYVIEQYIYDRDRPMAGYVLTKHKWT